MSNLDELLATIRGDLEPEEQLPALRAFDHLTEAQLAELTSAWYIKSSEAGIVMRYLPVARLLPYRAELLEYMQDYNWPAAHHVWRVLVAMGGNLVPEIRAVFRATPRDEIWGMWIINCVLSYWDDALNRELLAELRLVVGWADREGAAIAALQVLRPLLEPADFRGLYDYLRGRYAADPSMLEDLDYAFEDLAAPTPYDEPKP